MTMWKETALTGLLLWMSIGPAHSQNPPATVEWYVVLPYGSSQDTPARISVDQGVTYWMVEDDIPAWVVGGGVIRRYDPNGLTLTGYSPELTSIGCGGALDHPIDLHVRNDSIWGIAYWQQLGPPQDVLFCAQSPIGAWTPNAMANGAFLHDGVRSMLITADRRYLCAWHESSADQRDGRILSFDLADNVLWDVPLPEPTYGTVQSIAALGDSIAVAAFPNVHWLQASTGAYTSTIALYTGAEGAGIILVNGGELYWAARVAGAVQYGKLDGGGNALWSGSAPDLDVLAIAVDDLGRLWIGGNGTNEGRIVKVEANGMFAGSYSYARSVTDIDFSNGRLSWTGALSPGSDSTYLINTTPEP
jgi:hypothetical protein